MASSLPVSTNTSALARDPATALAVATATYLAAGPPQTLALPAKVIKKVLELEYVDMNELTWQYQEEDAKCCHQRHSQRRGPVTDILLWSEGFTSMVTILATKYPEKTGQFMAYLQTIVTFTGEGWVT